MITPLDVQKKIFNKSFRGYSEREVRDYLTQVSQTIEKHINENADLKERMKRVVDDVSKYRNIESTLSETLVLAQKTSEDIVASARKEAEQIVAGAKLQARATEEQMLRDLHLMQEKRMMMEKDLESFRLRMESLLRAQLEVVGHYKAEIFEEILRTHKMAHQVQQTFQTTVQESDAM